MKGNHLPTKKNAMTVSSQKMKQPEIGQIGFKKDKAVKKSQCTKKNPMLWIVWILNKNWKINLQGKKNEFKLLKFLKNDNLGDQMEQLWLKSN